MSLVNDKEYRQAVKLKLFSVLSGMKSLVSVVTQLSSFLKCNQLIFIIPIDISDRICTDPTHS